MARVVWKRRGVLLTLAISFCLVLSWAAAKVGLAPIVGAFAAGLILDEVHYKPTGGRKERDLHDLLQPVSTVLVPIFFVLMGLKVDLRLFTRVDILGFAVALTLAAIIGKQICALGVVERGINRLAVGLGMIPRGEVGLIFAGIGATLMLPSATGVSEPVISSAIFGAVVIMVIITTLITPIALKWSLGRKSNEQTGGLEPWQQGRTSIKSACHQNRVDSKPVSQVIRIRIAKRWKRRRRCEAGEERKQDVWRRFRATHCWQCSYAEHKFALDRRELEHEEAQEEPGEHERMFIRANDP